MLKIAVLQKVTKFILFLICSIFYNINYKKRKRTYVVTYVLFSCFLCKGQGCNILLPNGWVRLLLVSHLLCRALCETSYSTLQSHGLWMYFLLHVLCFFLRMLSFSLHVWCQFVYTNHCRDCVSNLVLKLPIPLHSTDNWSQSNHILSLSLWKPAW